MASTAGGFSNPRCRSSVYTQNVATFSARFPRAVHVLPLQAVRGILEDRALLAKTALRGPSVAVRATTFQTDLVLGLADYVHFYLLQPQSQWEQIPILATQLLTGRGAPFPHVALETDTGALADHDCVLCLWNIAVSRPGVDGHCKGGNWTRGTNPATVLLAWQRFRDQQPGHRRARGYWNDPFRIPTLRGEQIAEMSALLGRASAGMPELLLPSPVPIGNHFTLWVFSGEDVKVLRPLRGLLKSSGVRLRKRSLENYECLASDTVTWRALIARYFAGQSAFPAGLDFDRKR